MNDEQIELIEYLTLREYINQTEDGEWLFTKIEGDWIRQSLLDEMSYENDEDEEDQTYTNAFEGKIPDNFYDLMIIAFKNLGLTISPEDDTWLIPRNKKT